jgi:hypothetical protein
MHFFRKLLRYINNCKNNFRSALLEWVLGENYFDLISSKTILKRLLTNLNNPPLNNQKYRTLGMRSILESLTFTQIVESGTYLGDSTAFFSEFSDSVISFEINPLFFEYSKKRFKSTKNVTLYNVSSNNALKTPETYQLNTKTDTFFYLDAHWYNSHPLIEELRLIKSQFKSYLIVIDDFKVESDLNYNYDRYGLFLQKRLSLNLVKEFLDDVFIFFPKQSSSEEVASSVGPVGFVCLTNSNETATILRNTTTYFREYNFK